jgi:predicted ATPase
MNYWLVRAKWGGVDNKTTQFIQNDEWINGYDDKYLDTVNRVQEGDVLLLADNSLVNYYAKCEDNEKNGQNIIVDSWKKFKEPINFPAKGAYIKTIVKVNDRKLIEKSLFAIEELKVMESITIKSITLSNFTIFREHSLEFSSGINIIIGENGTGKTQVMKLMYSLLQSNNVVEKQNKLFLNAQLSVMIEKKINSIFMANSIGNLITKNKTQTEISLDLDKYKIHFELLKKDSQQLSMTNYENIQKLYEKKALFIPAKEVLSFFKGFRSIYRQTSFDETFNDLANNLGKLIPKNKHLNKFEEKILEELEEILEGKIILENDDTFYLFEKDGNKREITLVAEGLRKLGTIFHLLANGTIEKGSVMFWDEPEANLNPKYIKYVAKMLLSLEKAGIQIFIATHSLFLVNEIEILREKENQVEYFSFGFDEKKKLRVSQSSNLEELKDLVLLDEEIAQGDRFMMKDR